MVLFVDDVSVCVRLADHHVAVDFRVPLFEVHEYVEDLLAGIGVAGLGYFDEQEALQHLRIKLVAKDTPALDVLLQFKTGLVLHLGKFTIVLGFCSLISFLN